jgi:glycosyltransferase involved in cell wall biosynthesis
VPKPRVLFVGRTRYRLPLEPPLARKWDALSDVLDVRVLATAHGAASDDGRFRLLRDRPLPLFYPALVAAAAGEVRRFGPDVIVAQSPYEAAALAPVGGRAKVLLEVHGDWDTATELYGSPVRRVLRPLTSRAARFAVRRADAVRTVSPFTSELVRRAGVEPVATFTTYYDAAAFAERPPAPLPAEPSLLFVGVLERYKNVAGLAAAWRLAAPRVPGARLLLVGSGRERSVVERLVAALPAQTAWTERLDPDGVAAALDAASALVLPSFSEGLPRVAMEALARGRPVIGARAGGIPDIVTDGVNGVLVDPHDPASIAAGIVRVLGDRALLDRLADGARETAGRWQQTPEEFARRMRELVDALR